MATRAGILSAKRRAVGGKRDRCRKGKSCSAACINRNLLCLVDMPAPVEGALAKAVTAVRSRKKRLSPNERKEFLSKRRQKIVAKSKKRRNEIWKSASESWMNLNSYARKRDKKNYDREEERYFKLVSNYKRMGGKPNLEYGRGQIWKDVREQQDLLRYQTLASKIRSKLQNLAKSKDRDKYDKLEDKLLRLHSKFGNTSYKKGEVWEYQLKNRVGTVHRKLIKKMAVAVGNRDRVSYNKLESKLLKLQDKHRGYIPNYDIKERGQIWKDYRYVQYYKVKNGLLSRMENAAESGKRDVYDKLEDRLLRLQKTFGKYSDELTLSKGQFWDAVSSRGKLVPLNNEEDFTRTLRFTRGDYDKFVRQANEYLGKVLGYIDRGSSKEEQLYEGILKRIKESLGNEGLTQAIETIRSFSSHGEYKEIRAAQRNNTDGKEVKAMERLINSPELDHPRIVKFRGATVDDSRLEQILNGKGLRSEGATSSWSTELETAQRFSKSGKGKWGDNMVIFRTVNTRGIPIKQISSHEEEQEILTSREAKYKTLNYKVIEVEGERYYVVDVEES